MPIYDYKCPYCKWAGERMVRVVVRDLQNCHTCMRSLCRLVAAPYGKVRGRADGKVLGGPDQFTADVMGIPLKELPETLKAYPDKAKLGNS